MPVLLEDEEKTRKDRAEEKDQFAPKELDLIRKWMAEDVDDGEIASLLGLSRTTYTARLARSGYRAGRALKTIRPVPLPTGNEFPGE